MVNQLVEKLLDVMICRAAEARLKALKQEDTQGFLEDMGLEIDIPANPAAPAAPQKRRYARKTKQSAGKRKYKRRGHYKKHGKRQKKDPLQEAADQHARELRTADDIE